MMNKKVCVFLADGFEEIEGLTVVDLLRRAGVEVTTASIMGHKNINGAHAIEVMADALAEDVNYEAQDMLVLPGGLPGTTYLGENEIVCEQVKTFAGQGKWIAAICAAPTVFGNLGLLDGKAATCYPSMEEELKCGSYRQDSVVVSENIITSRGMGTAIDFSLKLIEVLVSKEAADNLAKGIVYER